MGLQITYQSKEDDDMAGQGTQADVRVYRTVDGELVGEGDPRGAFLAYAPGHTVPAGEVEAYQAVVAKGQGRSRADRANMGDEKARADLRARLARDPSVPVTTTPGEGAPQMHDRLATELADEQRVIANQGPQAEADAVTAVDPDAVVAQHPVYRTETGDLVHEGHDAAATLAYAPGDRVSDADVDQYNDLGEPETPAADDPETPAAETTPRTRTSRSRRS